MQNKKQTGLILELLALSAASLFFELLVIRWTSADIRAFSLLKSFPLATCYIGLGLGCALGSDRQFKWAPWALLTFVVLTRLIGDSALSVMPFPSDRIYDIASGGLANMNYADAGPHAAYLFGFVLVLIASLIGPFWMSVALGSRIGVLFNELKPLTAYSLNLGGALCGSIIFSYLSFRSVAPAVLVAPLVVVLMPYLLAVGDKKHKVIAATLVVPILVCCFWKFGQPTENQVFWSPYQRIDFSPIEAVDANTGKVVEIGHHLLANKYGQQYCKDLRPDFIDGHKWAPDVLASLKGNFQTYRVPYSFGTKTPDDVLILASGLGNDVASALRAGAKSVDAVEIDPVTIELGKKYHPEHPYNSPHVQVNCDDARHFLRQSKKKYDLIVFSFLDTMTVVSQSSAVRLDNFVYTKESLQSALHLLKPNGLLVIQFYASQPWFINRLFWTTTEAAGYQPSIFGTYDALDKTHNAQNIFILLGNPVKNRTLAIPPTLSELLSVIPSGAKPAHVLTDEWPYLYLAPAAVDLDYLVIVAIVVLLCVFIGRNMLFKQSSPRMWQMFFLGSGFLLLELQAISRLSLLFGATWLTSSVVICGVLVMLLLANLLVTSRIKWFAPKLVYLYLAMMVALAVSYLFPTDATFTSDPIIGYPSVTFVALLPMFVAALIFGTSFAQAKNSGLALGFNLFGAVLGAMLEYTSTYFGTKNLIVLAGFLYAVSLAAVWSDLSKQRTMTDKTSTPLDV